MQEGRGKRQKVEILWTGGYDSTFRIVQLSRMNVIIQPYYISDNRKSEGAELKAIEKITAFLKEHKDTKCKFEDLKIISVEDRYEDASIHEAWTELRKKTFFGSQYDWLGSFALSHKGIELSVHEDDKAILLINQFGSLKKVVDKVIGEYWVLDCKKSDPLLVKLFENYHFPLAKWTKLQMKDFYLKHQYEDVMNATWFCYNPIDGKPCGTCNPCVYTIEEGMKERFSKKALVRYYLKRVLGVIKKKH